MDILLNRLFWEVFVICLFVTYGMMFLIGFFLESRIPGRDMPIWKYQSKAFLPGDAGLSLMVATAACYVPQGFMQTGVSRIISMVGFVSGIMVFFIARKFLYTPKDYSYQAWHSPTKLWHDYVMFFGFTVAAVCICIPGYLMSLWINGKLIGITGFLIWVVGNIWDFTHNEIPNEYQHPTNYQPIWRKRIAAQ